MNATVWPNRIDILGAALPERAWKPLLDELKAEHVPSFTPSGRRLSVVVGPSGRVDAFVYRTHAMLDDEVVRILKKHGIMAKVGSEKPLQPACDSITTGIASVLRL